MEVTLIETARHLRNEKWCDKPERRQFFHRRSYETLKEGWHNEKSSELESSVSSKLNTSYYDQFSKTLSNYSAANLAFNSGAIDASVNVDGKVNHIDGIKTSAIGAVNSGSITVTVK